MTFVLKRSFLSVLVITATILFSQSAQALNVLLCNDDGIIAANLRALKQKLQSSGHKVLVAAPIDNQSGRGGFISFLQPIPPLTGNERSAKALGLPAGTVGVGSDPNDPDVYYVNGTPVAACLYGLDVQAPLKWGKSPDLVISGPNEGNNTGHINPSSGTFNNLLYAINRGIPALAVSDAVSTQVNWSPSLDPKSRPFEVADLVIRLVNQVLGAKILSPTSGQGSFPRLLPEGIGLNVNIPTFTSGAGSSLLFEVTHIGVATALAPAFYERLSDSSLAVSAGLNVPLPGVSLAPGGTVLPTGIVLPLDPDPTAEANVVAKGKVTISPVQGIPEASRRFETWLQLRLNP